MWGGICPREGRFDQLTNAKLFKSSMNEVTGF